MTKKLISIVIPVFNEEEIVKKTIDTLIFHLKEINYNYELIFINDGSIDDTKKIIKSYSETNEKIKLINFSRNFGHQLAFTAGLDYSKGDAVIAIDGDLQDPPEVIHSMIEKWNQGYDIVYGKRIKRKGETLFKKLTAKIFYRLLNKLSEIKIPVDVGDFRLMDRKVVNEIIAMREKHRFIRGMVSWVGFKQSYVEYVRDERTVGVTKYPLRKMINFALDGILSFSTLPIKYTINLGILSTSLALSGSLYAIFARLFTDGWVSGWTTIVLAIFFFSGVQLISVGIIGQYVGKIFEEIKQRPLYIIESTFNLDK